MDGLDVFLELLVERRCFLVVDHILVDLVFDDDKTEQVVVDDRGLHLVELLRVLANVIPLCREEEVAGHQASQHSIA